MSAAYIFDVEGTLIDCVPDNLKCWSETLAGFGVSVPAADLQRLSGMDGDEMLEILAPSLDEHARKKILTAQGERYRAIYLPRVKAFPGVRTVFTAIKSEGGRIALATDCQSDELKRYRRLIGADDLIVRSLAAMRFPGASPILLWSNWPSIILAARQRASPP